jgi:hypothetical protein
MRFSNADVASPINAYSTSTGAATTTPVCPSVTTTVANAMVLRIGGFDAGRITVDDAGMNGYTTITVDKSNTLSSSGCSGGAAYVTQSTAGGTGTSTFALTMSEEYVTLTIAIAPDDGT